MNESSLTREIRKSLAAAGFPLVWKISSTEFAVGLPDLLVARGGRVGAFEVKFRRTVPKRAFTPLADLTGLQQERLREAHLAGILAHVLVVTPTEGRFWRFSQLHPDYNGCDGCGEHFVAWDAAAGKLARGRAGVWDVGDVARVFAPDLEGR